MKNNIISLSGGKDSTAMLLMMLERKEPIHSVVFFDTGWEFPEMYDHIKKLQSRIDIEIKTIQPRKKFNDLLQKYRWPDAMRRWCTAEKRDAIAKYSHSIKNAVECVGYAYDEQHRTAIKPRGKRIMRYPLIEYGITETGALKYCSDNGFDWGGLYKLFSRVSCFCCPLQRIGELNTLRKFKPKLWKRILKMDKNLDDNRGFRGYKTVHDLDRRFAEEDRQMELF